MPFRFLITIILTLVLMSSDAGACSEVAGLTDRNCDGQIKIAVIGDSLVYGIGDSSNQNHGGYVLRAAQKLTSVEFVNLGTPGLNTTQLLLALSRAFRQSGEAALYNGVVDADVVVLDLGRNDRWTFGPPSATYRNLKRVRNTLDKKIVALAQVPPLVVTAVLMLPNRGSQGPWVKQLNELIADSDKIEAPADLRFDKVSKRLLSTDQIHPTSIGYSALAKVFTHYVQGRLKNHLTQNDR